MHPSFSQNSKVVNFLLSCETSAGAYFIVILPAYFEILNYGTGMYNVITVRNDIIKLKFLEHFIFAPKLLRLAFL